MPVVRLRRPAAADGAAAPSVDAGVEADERSRMADHSTRTVASSFLAPAFEERAVPPC
jgi:hypothetical protein